MVSNSSLPQGLGTHQDHQERGGRQGPAPPPSSQALIYTAVKALSKVFKIKGFLTLEHFLTHGLSLPLEYNQTGLRVEAISLILSESRTQQEKHLKPHGDRRQDTISPYLPWR